MEITEERVQKALDWLTENAVKGAKARATRLHLEDYSKSLLGRLMGEIKQENGKMAVELVKAAASSHPDYLEHLQALQYAIEEDELMRWRRDSARAVLDSFQTVSANRRAEKII